MYLNDNDEFQVSNKNHRKQILEGKQFTMKIGGQYFTKYLKL